MILTSTYDPSHEVLARAVSDFEKHKGLGILVVPTHDQLRAMLVSTFWASLIQEEGRFVRCAVSLLEKDAEVFAFRFEDPVPLDARLSPSSRQP